MSIILGLVVGWLVGVVMATNAYNKIIEDGKALTVNGVAYRAVPIEEKKE